MITIITGSPGSGKTYYIVKYISENYFIFNKINNQYEIAKHPENGKSYTIVTNIENLTLARLNQILLALDYTKKKGSRNKTKLFTI